MTEIKARGDGCVQIVAYYKVAIRFFWPCPENDKIVNGKSFISEVVPFSGSDREDLTDEEKGERVFTLFC